MYKNVRAQSGNILCLFSALTTYSPTRIIKTNKKAPAIRKESIMSEQLKDTALLEHAEKLRTIYEDFTQSVRGLGNKAKGHAGSKFGNSFAHWIGGGHIRTDRDRICEEFLEQVQSHLEFLETCLEGATREEAAQVCGVVADVMLEPIPVRSNATTDLMKRAMRSQFKPFLKYLTKERLELGRRQIQEGYRTRELLPVEREILKEIDRLIAKM